MFSAAIRAQSNWLRGARAAQRTGEGFGLAAIGAGKGDGPAGRQKALYSNRRSFIYTGVL